MTRPAAMAVEGLTAGHASFRLTVSRLVLQAGDAVALTGPSGSGKSTLLDTLALARPPLEARCFTLGTDDGEQDVAALWRQGADRPLTALRARCFGYVLQQGGLLPFLDVAGNVGFGPALLGQSDQGRGRRLMEALGLGGLGARAPATLSVGQRQRVAIARALAHGPGIVLADEPTASVHPGMADQVLTLLRDLARQEGVALLMATHDPARAAKHGFALLPIIPDAGGASSSRLEAFG